MLKIKKLSKLFSNLQNSKKYFLLNLSLNNETIAKKKEIFEKTYRNFTSDLDNMINKDEVLLILKSKKTLYNHFILFKSENEVLPYDTIKNSELQKKAFVKNVEIKEIEMTENEISKDLIKVYSYLAAHNLN